jgi:hypothetical protein
MYQVTAKVHVRRKAIIENRWANVFAIRTPTKVTIPRARRVMRFESFNDEIAKPPLLSVDPPFSVRAAWRARGEPNARPALAAAQQ